MSDEKWSVAPEIPMDGKWIITPEIAQRWLDLYNKKNRPPRKSAKADLVGIIRRGEYHYNGEPLAFCRDDEMPNGMRMVNGQHTCGAVVESGISIQKRVETGLDPIAFLTYDRHSARTNGDALYQAQETNYNAVAAAVTWLWRWEQKKLELNRTPSPEQVIAVLDRHPGVRESVAFTRNSGWLKTYGGGSVSSFTHYVGSTIDREASDRFFDQLSSGAGMTEGSPVLLLRDRLVFNRASKTKLPALQVLALYIKAWNAALDGRSVRFLRWRQEGDAAEPFPEFSKRRNRRA